MRFLINARTSQMLLIMKFNHILSQIKKQTSNKFNKIAL